LERVGEWGERIKAENQKARYENDSAHHMLLFKAMKYFQPERKKKNKNKNKNTSQLFLFHPNWVVCPLAVAMTTAALLLLHLDLFPN
jgi:hypothetical protein